MDNLLKKDKNIEGYWFSFYGILFLELFCELQYVRVTQPQPFEFLTIFGQQLCGHGRRLAGILMSHVLVEYFVIKSERKLQFYSFYNAFMGGLIRAVGF